MKENVNLQQNHAGIHNTTHFEEKPKRTLVKTM